MGAGELEKALPYAEQAEALAIKIYGLNSREYMSAVTTTGSLYQGLEKFEKAVDKFKIVADLARKQYDKDHDAMRLAKALENLAYTLSKAGKHAEALTVTDEIVTLTMSATGENSLDTAKALSFMGMTLTRAKRYREAESIFRESIKIYDRTLGPNHVATLPTLLNLGWLYQQTQQNIKAEKIYLLALDIMRSNDVPTSNPLMKATLANLQTLRQNKK